MEGADQRAELVLLDELDLVEEEGDPDVLGLRGAPEMQEQLDRIVGEALLLELLEVDRELEAVRVGELERGECG